MCCWFPSSCCKVVTAPRAEPLVWFSVIHNDLIWQFSANKRTTTKKNPFLLCSSKFIDFLCESCDISASEEVKRSHFSLWLIWCDYQSINESIIQAHGGAFMIHPRWLSGSQCTHTKRFNFEAKWFCRWSRVLIKLKWAIIMRNKCTESEEAHVSFWLRTR